MVPFLRRYSVLVTIGGLLAISLGLLIANAGGRRRVDPLGAVFLELVTPATSAIGSAAGVFARTWAGYVNLVGVRQENSWLRKRVREFEARSDRMTELENQNSRLQALLDLRESMPGQAVAARVTGADMSGLFRTAILNKGQRDGVVKGMAVVAPQGVVGQIVAASPNASRVLLLDDPSSGVAAAVARSNARGLVEGGPGVGCLLRYVKPREDVQPGDRVVTSGLDGVFPKGLLIGEITTVVQGDRGLFQSAEIQPAVDLSKLEEVLVVAAPAIEVPPVPPRARSAPEPHATAAP